MNEDIYVNFTKKSFIDKFPNAIVINEDIPGIMEAWQIVFKNDAHKIYIGAEKGSLDFHVISQSGKNLGLRHKNEIIFHDFLKTNEENINLIINFLYKHKTEIFRVYS